MGNEVFPEPVFYAYLYPEPIGYSHAGIMPEEAYYHLTLGEFILPYSIVQQSEDEERILLDFLESTYQVGADLAGWDSIVLEE
jgi:hypothetical protein